MQQAELSRLLSISQYSQMTLQESAIARAWLEKHGAYYDRVQFNPYLGNSVELGPEYDEATRRQAQVLFQKRPDILAWRGETVTIVEIKPRLGFAALGQLLGYRLLYQVANPDVPSVDLVAIGHSASIDTPEVLMAYGVSVELFHGLKLIGVEGGESE